MNPTNPRRLEILDKVVELRVRSPEEPSRSALDEVDVVIDAVVSPGWRNERPAFGVRYEREGGELSRVVVEQVGVHGAFTPTPRGFAGSFTVDGRSSEHLDGLVSLGFSLLCEARGDLLLHASAVMAGDRACLFLGEGGAGKTTIATELNGDRTTLCVDRAAVSERPDGVLRVYSTPLGDGDGAPERPESAAVGGLFFIVQAREHGLTKLSPWEATRRLLKSAIASSRDPELVQHSMEMVGRLVDLDASYELRFRKDAGFWPLIEEALSKGC